MDEKTKETVRGFVRYIRGDFEEEHGRLEGVYLGGSHTKGTSNADSDIDLQIVYRPSLEDLLRFDALPVSLEKERLEKQTDPESGATSYLYQGREIEPRFTPCGEKTPRRSSCTTSTGPTSTMCSSS